MLDLLAWIADNQDMSKKHKPQVQKPDPVKPNLCPKHGRWQSVVYGSAVFDASCTPACPMYEPPHVRKTIKELIEARRTKESK